MPPPERRADESPAAFRAFCDYAAMGNGGKGRSLRDLLAAYVRQSSDNRLTERPPTQKWGTLSTWSLRHAWVDRASAYDAQIAADEERARSAIRAARRAELEEADWSTGESLRQACAAMLAKMPQFLQHTELETRQNGELVKVITLALKAGPGELARAFEMASKLQRLSVGEATEIHRLVESELEALFDVLKHNLPPDEYARIVDLARGAAAR